MEKVSIIKIGEKRLTKHEKYSNSNFNILVEIILELSATETKEFKTSIRVNKIIWEQLIQYLKRFSKYGSVGLHKKITI